MRETTAARLPPALSPPTAMRFASPPMTAALAATQRVTAYASSPEAGEGCSGARREATDTTPPPAAVAGGRQTPAGGSRVPVTPPPPRKEARTREGARPAGGGVRTG